MMLLTQLTAISWLLTFHVTQTYQVVPPSTQYLPNGNLRGGNAGVTVVINQNAVENVTLTFNFKPSDGRKGVLCYAYDGSHTFPETIPVEGYTPARQTVPTIANCVNKCAQLGKYTYAGLQSGGDAMCACFNEIFSLVYYKHGCSSCLWAYHYTLASDKGCNGKLGDFDIMYVMTTCPDGYYGPPGCLNRGRKECRLNSPATNMPNAECDLGNIVQFNGSCFYSDTPLPWCTPNPCKNGGACYNDACTCTSDFTGIICETALDCTGKPCSSGASSCVPSGKTYTCVCFAGFTGQRCEQDINECESNPCPNGGMCQNNIGQYKCTCPSYASGTNCQTDIGLDECHSNPCLHGATCQDLINGWSCTCPPGFTGIACAACYSWQYCAIAKGECSPNPCLNGGRCRVTSGQASCKCAGFSRPFCETEIDECVSGPCTGNQICLDHVNSYHCTDRVTTTVTTNSTATKDPGRLKIFPSSSMSLHGSKGIIQLLSVVVLLWSLAHDHPLSAHSAKTSVSLYSCHITV